MKKLHSVSYRKVWDNVGTVYDQTITISDDELTTINTAICEEIANGYPNKTLYSSTPGYAEVFLKPIPVGVKEFFSNHTQRNFFHVFLRLPLKDRNTRFVVLR